MTNEPLDDDIKKALKVISNLDVTIIMCTEIINLSEDAPFSKAVLILSPSRLILVYPPDYEMRSWKRLLRIEYKSPCIILSFVGHEYIFRSFIPDELMARICQFLQRVLLRTELRQIGFDELNAPPIGPGTKSFAARYMLCDSTRFNDNFDKLLQTVIGNRNTQELKKMEDLEEFLPTFVDLLPFIQTFTYIRFPRIEGYNIMTLLADLPLNLRYLYMIELVGEIYDGFDRFLSCIKTNKNNSKLNSLSFENSHLDKHQLLLLSDAIVHGAIKSIEFHRAIHPDYQPYFYNHFLSHKIDRSLYILNLDRTPDIDLKLLFSHVKNIPLISLAYCDLDIGNVFKEIFEADISNISVLNLTGNNASYIPEIPEGAIVPVTLRKIILDNISWPTGFFTPYFKFLFEYFEYGVSLSFSNAVASEEDWNQLFEYLSTCKYTKLLGISWIDNPIHLEFIKFLHRNPDLYSLNIDKCLRNSHKEILVELSALIRDSKRLSLLSAAGSRSNYVGPLIKQVFSACIGHPSLETINLQCQIGGSGIVQLALQIVTAQSPLKFFNFEGFCPNNAAQTSVMLDQMSQYQDRVKISFPTLDLIRFVKFKKMTNDEMIKLRQLFMLSYNDDEYDSIMKKGKFDIPHLSEEVLNIPSIIYKYYPDDPFPPYFDNQRMENLKKELIYLPLHSNVLFPRQELHNE